MACLSIRLLGSFQATLDGEPVTGFESDKVRALLAYLVTEPDRPHRREVLAGLLWPDYPERSARANVRRALANLRKAIGDHEATPPFLHISQQTIQFNATSNAWSDVTAFTNLLEAKSPSQQTLHQLEEAVTLYSGSFLEGFSIADSAFFEEWALLKRERLRRQALATLYRLAAHYGGRGEYERALPYAWQRVELDPWREQAHRQLMLLLALNGQRGAALNQYEVCRRDLAKQLGVEPAAETTRLYEQIRDGERIDWGQAENQSLAHETGVTPGTLVAPPPTQRRTSKWRMAGGRLALVVSGLLLLIIVGAITIFTTGKRFGGATPSEVSTPIAAFPEESKTLDVCQGATHPQLGTYDARTDQCKLVTDDLEFECIGPIASWSPDGQQIVFDAGMHSGPLETNDLYIINADGSGLKQITSGDTHDAMPAWSHDGQWITFSRGGELWTIHPDGSEAQRLFGQTEFVVGMAAWSPDSQQIAFLLPSLGSTRPDEAKVINRDGTGLRTIHSFERPLEGAFLGWSPDGQKIAYYLEFGDIETIETIVLLINADGSGDPQIVDETPWSWFPNFWPQWIENDFETFVPSDFVATQFEGSKVVQVCENETSRQLCVYKAYTGQRLLMTNLEFEAISTHNWSPDGAQIVLSAGSEPMTGRHDHKVYIVNADGSDLRQITSGDTHDILPAWSPDGEWIAFQRSGALWLVRPDGSEAGVLFEQEESCVGAIAWSPDGQRIAFWLKTKRETVPLDEIWVINQDGTGIQVMHSFERPLVMANLTWDPQGYDILCHCDFDTGEKKNLLFTADKPGAEPLAIEVIPHSWFPNFWPQWEEPE